MEFSTAENGKIGDLIDILAINRYYGWYYDHGDTSVIKDCMKKEFATRLCAVVSKRARITHRAKLFLRDRFHGVIWI